MSGIVRDDGKFSFSLKSGIPPTTWNRTLGRNVAFILQCEAAILGRACGSLLATFVLGRASVPPVVAYARMVPGTLKLARSASRLFTFLH